MKIMKSITHKFLFVTMMVLSYGCFAANTSFDQTNLKQKTFLTELTKKAESGDAKSQYILGVYYKSNAKDDKDKQLAIQWLQKAANNHVIDAYNELGAAYTDGAGVKKDLVKAMEMYKKAAELGDAAAMFNSGLHYFYGAGCTQDYKQAYDWFIKAAHAGDTFAQYMLFRMYFNGIGVKKDIKTASNWLTLVAYSVFNKIPKELYDEKKLYINTFITYQLASIQKITPKYAINTKPEMIQTAISASKYLDKICSIGGY